VQVLSNDSETQGVWRDSYDGARKALGSVASNGLADRIQNVEHFPRLPLHLARYRVRNSGTHQHAFSIKCEPEVTSRLIANGDRCFEYQFVMANEPRRCSKVGEKPEGTSWGHRLGNHAFLELTWTHSSTCLDR